jgi:Zn-dependent protease with chaperone function
MTVAGVIRFLALSGVAFLVFNGLAAVLAAVAQRWVSASIRALPPSFRARVLLAWAAAPVAIAIALVAATLWPSVGASLGLVVDHCPVHGGHLHLCLHHLPESGPGVAGVLSLAAFALALVVAFVQGVRSAALSHQLRRAASLELAPGVGLIESEQPFALTAGWVRPRVLVSTALSERLTREQLDVVLAHEHAHAARNDALAVTFARVLAYAHLPAVRRHIVAELTLACEQACDEIAATSCGDRVLVAETIVAAERAAGSDATVAAAGPAFGGGAVVERVESLLDAPVERAASLRPIWILIALGAATAAVAPQVHHWTETFLDLLTR